MDDTVVKEDSCVLKLITRAWVKQLQITGFFWGPPCGTDLVNRGS